MNVASINPARIGIITAAAVVGLITLMGSWYTVDSGDRGVILRNGEIVGTAEPGLGFKVPMIDRVLPISVRDLSRVYESLPAYSRDQQTGVLMVSVTFAVPEDSVAEVYETYGSIDNMVNRLVDRQVNEQLRNVFGKFTAVSAVQERERLTNEFKAAVIDAIEGPVIIRGVQIENIDFSDVYEDSIEQRMLAEVEVQKIRQNAEKERVAAEILVIQANAAADSTRAREQANAEAIRMRGEAEAAAIAARGKALQENPNLITLVTAEKWDGVLPQSMIPGGAVPFLELSQGQTRPAAPAEQAEDGEQPQASGLNLVR